MFTITKEEQLAELTKRITPIVNVNVIVHKEGKFLIGHRNVNHKADPDANWLFPGGRMKYTETLQEAAIRKLNEELPGINATLRKLVTVQSDMGYDPRANGISIYYLFDYLSGEPKANEQMDDFAWLSLKELEKKTDFYPLEKTIISEVIVALKYMNSNSDEMIVQVDENDNVIGKVSKLAAHNDREIYHRAALIVVFNSKRQVILHQRSFLKDSNPGKWDIFGGHNTYTMSIELTAKSELLEELGIDTPLEFKFKYLYRRAKQSEFMYVYETHSDGPYAYDRNEVERIKAFDTDKILNGDYDKEYKILWHVKTFLKMLSEM